jgi:hypothetical protein
MAVQEDRLEMILFSAALLLLEAVAAALTQTKALTLLA